MNVSSLKSFLANADRITIELPDGTLIPSHFHITEMGLLTKHFIDCGGTVRIEKYATIQVWTANDTDHRLTPEKLNSIISIYERVINNEDLEIEVEYQSESIGKYGLEVNGSNLMLTSKFTNCLAKDHCGIPVDKLNVNMKEFAGAGESCCTPGGGCC